MLKRVPLVFAVIALATASGLFAGSEGGPGTASAGKPLIFRVTVPHIARDPAPPTPLNPNEPHYVVVIMEKTITNVAHTSTVSMTAKGIHPTVVEPPVTASGDATVTDTLTGLSEGCTSRVTMPNTNLRMILEPSDPSASDLIRVRFTGKIVWGVDLDCKGQPVTHAIKDITVTDMLGPAMRGYYSSYGGGYAFNPGWTGASVDQCVVRRGHFEGVDAQGPQTTQVSLDVLVTRGDCYRPIGFAD